jgi:hypothetical protein
MMDGNDTRNASLRRREMHDRAQTCTVSLGEGTEEYCRLDAEVPRKRSENDDLCTVIWEKLRCK